MSNIEAIDSLIQQADLQSLNTLAVPAYARYLKYVENIEQLRSALNFAQRENLQTLILGEGSNIVFSGDFSGLVICNRCLLYTSPSPRDQRGSRMPSSA